MEIRKLEGHDAGTIHSWYSDPSVTDHFLESGPVENYLAMSFWLYADEISSQIFIASDHMGSTMGILRIYRELKMDVEHNASLDIMVGPSYRGRGIGTALIKHAENWVKEHWGTENIHLEVYEKNPALGLYQRLGYSICGYMPNYLKDGRKKYYLAKKLYSEPSSHLSKDSSSRSRTK